MFLNAVRRQAAERIFRYAVKAVQPAPLMAKQVQLVDTQLTLAQSTFDVSTFENIYVVGAGKATAPMAEALEILIGDYISDGVIIVKYGHTVPLKRIRTVEAAHPIPDENGIRGTAALLQLAAKASEKDLVICLLSGGGSSLLTDTPPGCSLSALQLFFEQLLESGAAIGEMNTVRKYLSAVKGGGLAQAIYPAQLVSLILSDVIGDSLEVIASGPTVPTSTTYTDVIRIMERYDLLRTIPPVLQPYFQVESAKDKSQPLGADSVFFEKVENYLIGSNTIALRAAQREAERLGFPALILTDQLSGEAREVATYLVTEAQRIKANPAIRKPICLLWGGETTVTLHGHGVGGRNQELALAAAIELENRPGICLLSGGTDGTDGPTDAAGAVVDEYTVKQARSKGLEPAFFLNSHDSYSFFSRVGGHIITGPTLTNVMDIMIALVD